MSGIADSRQQESMSPAGHQCRLETKTAITRFSFGIDGMSQQRLDAPLLSNRHRSADGILQQAGTKPLNLIVEIDSKPRQDDQWNRVLAHAATSSLGCFLRVDLT